MTSDGMTRITIHAGTDSPGMTPCIACAWMTSSAAMNPVFRTRTVMNIHAEP